MRMTHTSEDRGKTSFDDNGIFARCELCEKALFEHIVIKHAICAICIIITTNNGVVVVFFFSFQIDIRIK